MVRTGDEPAHARSPLGLRLALTIAGTVLWAVAAGVMLGSGRALGETAPEGFARSLLEDGFKE